MDIRNNNELDLFAALPEHNTILNWLAGMSPEVKRAILDLQNRLTKKALDRCKKGKKFEYEIDTASMSLNFFEEGEMELEYDGEQFSYLLNIAPFSESDLNEMLEEADNNLEAGSFSFQMEYEIASLEITDNDRDIEQEYSLTQHKVNDEIYLFLAKGDVEDLDIYVDSDKTIKKRISAEELEDYFHHTVDSL